VVKAIPDGYRTITMQLVVSPCGEAIDWYQKVFDAEDRGRVQAPDGTIMHAELQIGDSRLMLMDPMMGGKSPRDLGGTNATVHLYVKDADALWRRALEAGATVVTELRDEFWGDRYGIVTDPFGQQWAIATHKEDVSPNELERRIATLFASGEG
jgi:PhnB protein